MAAPPCYPSPFARDAYQRPHHLEICLEILQVSHTLLPVAGEVGGRHVGDQPDGDPVHLAADGEFVRPGKSRRDVEDEINQATAVDIDPLVADSLVLAMAFGVGCSRKGYGTRPYQSQKGKG